MDFLVLQQINYAISRIGLGHLILIVAWVFVVPMNLYHQNPLAHVWYSLV